MTTLDQQGRPAVIERLKSHLGSLTGTIDKQAPVVLRKHDVRIVDAFIDDREHATLIGQYSTGERREFTRKDYLPEGDDGTSVVYQAQVLEQLALEQAAVARALGELEKTQRLLDNPPSPMG